MGMALTVDDLDIENVAFFGYCAKGDFRLQKCKENGLFRYPPTTRCPFSGSAPMISARFAMIGSAARDDVRPSGV